MRAFVVLTIFLGFFLFFLFPAPIFAQSATPSAEFLYVNIATASADSLADWFRVQWIFQGILLFVVGAFLGIQLYKR